MSAPRTFWSRRTLYRWAPWVGGGMLVVGVSAFLFAFYGNTADKSEPETQLEGPALLGDQAGRRVKSAAPEIQKTAAQFIKNAVAGQNRRAGWKLIHPELRGDITFKQWLRGESYVIPYPADLRQPPPFRVDEVYEKRAELEVVLSPRPGANVKKPQIFFIGLKKVGKGANERWLVYYWAPRSVALRRSTGEPF
ncbi:MAG: hypothetical protein ABR583_15020 [Gaiellaceae bacterium]